MSLQNGTRVNMKIAAHIKPNSKTESVKNEDGIVVVRVHAPAVDGKANEAAIRLIARRFGVPKTRVKIIRGAASCTKLIEISGL